MIASCKPEKLVISTEKGDSLADFFKGASKRSENLRRRKTKNRMPTKTL